MYILKNVDTLGLVNDQCGVLQNQYLAQQGICGAGGCDGLGITGQGGGGGRPGDPWPGYRLPPGVTLPITLAGELGRGAGSGGGGGRPGDPWPGYLLPDGMVLPMSVGPTELQGSGLGFILPEAVAQLHAADAPGAGEAKPWYKQWWPYALAAGAVVVTGGTIYAVRRGRR